ncbi:hypothetical protein [[Clostridium] symbiosum]|uniref:hypothetical protein n=1 Tax=Clostridium symbiosum TaxID=1512 RepID=UPI000C2F96DB|nr:hypothetical protein [[Clostridium] symbiosum]MBS6221384.1 hypothetical protein [[Clostridium] symbiosum]MCQ4988450.1 hypothetical protein [[Clostridium] symbiosum]PKB53961.1 hypothetical protein CRH03_01250 [Clostridium sp. HMb25]
MWPIGTYERFLRKIKGQEGRRKVNYFGILLCDIRQAKAKEYILNYLEVFDDESSENIDFYIPGYILRDNNGKTDNSSISIKGKYYKYDEQEYFKFCKKLEYDFNVLFPFSATLVLMEYLGGDFSNARKMIFELESSEEGIRSAGKFFIEIFRIAAEGNMGQTLDEISRRLSGESKKGIILAGGKTIMNFFGVDVEPIINQLGEITKYKIK